jgi:hypothetical protein
LQSILQKDCGGDWITFLTAIRQMCEQHASRHKFFKGMVESFNNGRYIRSIQKDMVAEMESLATKERTLKLQLEADLSDEQLTKIAHCLLYEDSTKRQKKLRRIYEGVPMPRLLHLPDSLKDLKEKLAKRCPSHQHESGCSVSFHDRFFEVLENSVLSPVSSKEINDDALDLDVNILSDGMVISHSQKSENFGFRIGKQNSQKPSHNHLFEIADIVESNPTLRKRMAKIVQELRELKAETINLPGTDKPLKLRWTVSGDLVNLYEILGLLCMNGDGFCYLCKKKNNERHLRQKCKRRNIKEMVDVGKQMEESEEHSELGKYKNFCAWREEEIKKRMSACDIGVSSTEQEPNSLDAFLDEVAGFVKIKYLTPKADKNKTKKKRKQPRWRLRRTDSRDYSVPIVGKALVLGRGILGITDKRCSRRQLRFFLGKETDVVQVKVLGMNPVFLKPKDMKEAVIIRTEEQKTMKAGDIITMWGERYPLILEDMQQSTTNQKQIKQKAKAKIAPQKKKEKSSPIPRSQTKNKKQQKRPLKDREKEKQNQKQSHQCKKK